MTKSQFVFTLLTMIVIASCARPASEVTNPPAAAQHALTPPPVDALAPADFPGLPNVVTYASDLYSGGAPEGDEGIDSLTRLGIRTIISVDGAMPDVEAARVRGMRYVHLPIGYNGMDEKRTVEIARAAHDLAGPIYIHCHHGKHRSAGATGAAAVTLGYLSNDQALARMKVSGTSPSYPGLFEAVRVATFASPPQLAAASNDFPERWEPSGLVASMVAIDESFDQLKEVKHAGWKVPADHPDLVPTADAGKIADLYRLLGNNDRVKAKPAEFGQWIAAASAEASALEESLAAGADPATLTAQFKLLGQSCKTCHAKYRD